MKSEELECVGNKYGKTSAELGRLKGAMTNHVDAMNRMKEEHRRVLDKQKDEIEQLKMKVVQLKDEIHEKKKSYSFVKQNEDELKRILKKMEYELDKRATQLETAEYQRKIDQRIEYYMMRGRDAAAVDLLLQLRHNSETCSRFDIKPSEYLPLLKTLLEQENPALHSQLENCGLPNNKLTMCYLMALGLDDIDMMSRAACLAPNSVKAYRKECREVVYSNERKRN